MKIIINGRWQAAKKESRIELISQITIFIFPADVSFKETQQRFELCTVYVNKINRAHQILGHSIL
jgi:hypothetical protein